MRVTSTVPFVGLDLRWSAEAARKAQETRPLQTVHARVLGCSTRVTKNLGAHTLRLELRPEPPPGSHVCCFVWGGRLWPGIVGVPGDAPDSRGGSRAGLAELLVMCRPVAGEASLTFLPEDVLRRAASGELRLVAPLGSFTSGMTGTWLRMRLGEVVGEAESWAIGAPPAARAAVLAAAGLVEGGSAEPPEGELVLCPAVYDLTALKMQAHAAKILLNDAGCYANAELPHARVVGCAPSCTGLKTQALAAKTLLDDVGCNADTKFALDEYRPSGMCRARVVPAGDTDDVEPVSPFGTEARWPRRDRRAAAPT